MENITDRDRRFTITANAPIAKDTWRMVLRGDTGGFAPGRFANLMVPGYYLRRPLAISSYSDTEFTVIYKLAGQGTRALAGLQAGIELDILCPLGNGFTPKTGGRALLIGGGAGIAPMHALAQSLRQNGCGVSVALGFGTVGEAYLCEELGALSDGFHLACVDGTLGEKGLVTEVLAAAAEGCDYYYACGPTPMLKAVCAALEMPGEVSLEERMACGFGGCMGCAVKTKSGMRRVCADGPVFDREEMLW